MSIRSAFLLAAAIPLAAGCRVEVQPPPSDVPPGASRPATRPIDIRDAYTGIGEPLRELIVSRREWEGFWSRLTANHIPRPSPPDVDFGSEVVVVAAMGTQPTGGYDVRIDSVEYVDDTLWVRVTSVKPGPGCITTQSLTAPVALVAVERRPHPSARFFDDEETRTCE